MTISIVIPTLNEAENLEALIPYLHRNGDHRLLEIIIIDAAKTKDETPEVIKNLSVKYQKLEHCGRAVQMNAGAKMASGDILYFVHADARPPKTYLNDITESIQSGYALGFFAYQFDSKHPLLRWNAHYTKHDGMFAGGGDQTLFIDKKTFQQLNGFDETYCIMEDFDLIRRVRKAGISYKIVQNPVLISARKYQANNYFKVNFANLIVFTMFRLGFSPITLKKTYRRLLKLN